MTFDEFLSEIFPLYKSHDLEDIRVTVGEMRRLVAMYLQACNTN